MIFLFLLVNYSSFGKNNQENVTKMKRLLGGYVSLALFGVSKTTEHIHITQTQLGAFGQRNLAVIEENPLAFLHNMSNIVT
jgi:hypothetical protein